MKHTLKTFPDLADEKYRKMMNFYNYKDANKLLKTLAVTDTTKIRITFIEDVLKWHSKIQAELERLKQDKVWLWKTDLKKFIDEVLGT